MYNTKVAKAAAPAMAAAAGIHAGCCWEQLRWPAVVLKGLAGKVYHMINVNKGTRCELQPSTIAVLNFGMEQCSNINR